MSGRKNVLLPVKVADAVNIATNQTGSETVIQYMDRVSYQAVFTGTPSGELFIDGSVDGVSWVPLDIDAMAVTAADTLMIDIHDTALVKVRPRWVDGGLGGSGTMTVHISAKAA